MAAAKEGRGLLKRENSQQKDVRVGRKGTTSILEMLARGKPYTHIFQTLVLRRLMKKGRMKSEIK